MGSNPRAFPIIPSALSRGSAQGETGRRDRHRAFLSQPHRAAATCRPGLPMSLYPPGSSLFSERHVGKFTIRQTLTGVFGNTAVTMRDSPRPQTVSLFLKCLHVRLQANTLPPHTLMHPPCRFQRTIKLQSHSHLS